MQSNTVTESPFKTAIKMLGGALIAFLVLMGTLLLVFAIHVYTSQIPETDLEIATVSLDSMFYVGKDRTKDRVGGYLSIRARGELNDSTATVSVKYPGYAQEPLLCKLPKRKFDQIWSGDYYDSRAKITYNHKTVSQGKLRLQIVFSYPPSDWEMNKENL